MKCCCLYIIKMYRTMMKTEWREREIAFGSCEHMPRQTFPNITHRQILHKSHQMPIQCQKKSENRLIPAFLLTIPTKVVNKWVSLWNARKSTILCAGHTFGHGRGFQSIRFTKELHEWIECGCIHSGEMMEHFVWMFIAPKILDYGQFNGSESCLSFREL